MNGLAQVAALVSALAYIGAAVLEMFFFSGPRVRTRLWGTCLPASPPLPDSSSCEGATRSSVGPSHYRVPLHAARQLAMGVADLLGYWRPRGGSALGTTASSLPPVVALIAAST